MAKQDRNIWFDSINHLPLKPVSSTTEQTNKQQALNQKKQTIPNLAKTKDKESKEAQQKSYKEALPIDSSNNKQLSEGKSLPEQTIINKETSTPIKKGVKKVDSISESSDRQPDRQNIVSTNDLPLETASPDTTLSDIAHVTEEEEFPPLQDPSIVEEPLDDQQVMPLPEETFSDENSSTDSIQKNGSTKRKRATKNSDKSTARKKSKKESSSKKREKYISSRMIKETYKKMISEYPLMCRTELVDSIVKFFLKHPKRQRDQWLNEQCGGLDKY